MARAPATTADRLSALITEIEAEAYARGRADARTELLDLLGTGAGRGAGAKPSRGRPAKPATAPKRRASGRKRAPKGSVPRFVEQALRDNPGQTPPEILVRAADDMERLIKLPSIRAELRNGGKQGKYEQRDGRWFLAGSDAGVAEAGPAPASETLPAAEPEQALSDATAGTSSSEGSPGSELHADASSREQVGAAAQQEPEHLSH